MQMATLLPLPASLLALAKVMLAQRVNTAAQAARAGFQFSSACCMPSPAQQLTWQQTMQLPTSAQLALLRNVMPVAVAVSHIKWQPSRLSPHA